MMKGSMSTDLGIIKSLQNMQAQWQLSALA